jgi:hypothetical protein
MAAVNERESRMCDGVPGAGIRRVPADCTSGGEPLVDRFDCGHLPVSIATNLADRTGAL